MASAEHSRLRSRSPVRLRPHAQWRLAETATFRPARPAGTPGSASASPSAGAVSRTAPTGSLILEWTSICVRSNRSCYPPGTVDDALRNLSSSSHSQIAGAIFFGGRVTQHVRQTAEARGADERALVPSRRAQSRISRDGETLMQFTLYADRYRSAEFAHHVPRRLMPAASRRASYRLPP